MRSTGWLITSHHQYGVNLPNRLLYSKWRDFQSRHFLFWHLYKWIWEWSFQRDELIFILFFFFPKTITRGTDVDTDKWVSATTWGICPAGYSLVPNKETYEWNAISFSKTWRKDLRLFPKIQYIYLYKLSGKYSASHFEWKKGTSELEFQWHAHWRATVH